jgi:hypothetical protein
VTGGHGTLLLVYTSGNATVRHTSLHNYYVSTTVTERRGWYGVFEMLKEKLIRTLCLLETALYK